MKILEPFERTSSAHSLAPDSPHELNALEQQLVTKRDKLYVRYPVRQKDVLAKPEEIVRQLWIGRLTKEYGYPLNRLAVEYPVVFGRDSSKRADIVVFDADRPTVPYIFVEVKEDKAKDGKDQLKSYTHATGAPLALWSNGAQAIVWHRKNPNYFVVIPDLPTASQSIEDIVGQPWTIETLVEKEREREAEGARARSLRELIEDLEHEVLANAGVDVSRRFSSWSSRSSMTRWPASAAPISTSASATAIPLRSLNWQSNNFSMTLSRSGTEFSQTTIESNYRPIISKSVLDRLKSGSSFTLTST